MMFWNHGGWGFGDWLMMTLVMVAFWGLLLALVVWLVRGFDSESASRSKERRTTADGADEVAHRQTADSP